MTTLEEILAAAKELDSDEKSILVKALIEDCDDPGVMRFHDAWMAEISRRRHAYESGEEPTIPWAVVRERIQGKLLRDD